MQQTRVDQGLSYYFKFVNNFPTITSLALADEETILNLWQGLGYYSRARNLHNTAKLINSELDGKFPNNYNELIKLKGIGPYTAAAIASFSFDEQRAVVDGNVYRVLSRIFNIHEAIDSTNGKKVFQELANQLIPINNPAEHNQAIMEFGALQCTPKNPNCSSCPFQFKCEAFHLKKVTELPVKSKKIKSKDRFFHYIIPLIDSITILEKRTNEKDIWRHLYQFPLIETNSLETPIEIKQAKNYYKIDKVYKHILSHQKLHTQFYILKELKINLKDNQFTIPLISIQDYPLPRLIDRFLEENTIE